MTEREKTAEEMNREFRSLETKYQALKESNEKEVAAAHERELELEQCESNYRSLVDSSSALIWTSGVDKLCDSFNEKWLEFTGRSLEQELGNGWAEGVHPDDFGRCLEIYTDAFDRREPFQMEYRLKHNNGSYHWIVDFGMPRYDRDGCFLGYMGHCYDVDARKQTEEALRESEAMLSRSEQIAHLGSWIFTESGNRLEWSDEVFRILGCRPKEFEPTYDGFLGFIHPDDRVAVDQAFIRSVQEGCNIHEIEHRIVRNGTGEVRYVHERCIHERDASGAILRSVGIIQDITAKKEADEEIRWRNEDLQLMIAVTNAVNSNLDFDSIVNIIASLLQQSYDTHLISIFLPDKKTGELVMFGNDLDRDMVRDVEKTIRRPFPRIRFRPNQIHPFSEIDRTGTGILSVGKEETVKRLEGYLKGTPWPATIQKFIEKMLPFLADMLEYRSSVAVAMKGSGETAGYLELGSRRTMTPRDVKRLQSIADQLASVIARFDAEKKRQESEEMITNAFNYASIGMAFVSPGGRWLKVNHAVPAMLGYTEQELMEKTFQEVTHPDDLAADLDYVRQMLAGTISTYHMEKRYIHKSGRAVWALLSVSLVHDDSGNPLHFISQIQDITDRKTAEEVILHSEKKFRTLFETMVQGVVYQDARGMIFSANPAAERILGLSPDQMQGRTSVDPQWHAIHEDGSPFPGETHPAMVSLRTGEMNTAVMGVFNPGEDRYRWINVTAIPEFRNGESKPYQVCATFEEITELKTTFDELKRSMAEREKIREEITKLNADLEARVTERTSQLLESIRELESFSYSVSHDLRAPLRAINGYTGILMTDYHDRLDEEGRRLCEVIRQNTGKMGTLIDDLLSFSRCSRAEIRKSAFDMKALFISVYRELTDEEMRKSIDFSIGDMCSVHGDPILIRQVIANLLSNAIKFTSKRARPEISAGFEHVNDRLVFSVRDNGAGFDSKYANKVFGVFERLHSVKEFDGTGIGLAIVRRIIERHGGEVWAESEIGKGATFWFSLPGAP